MYCKEARECSAEIKEYFGRAGTGHILLINTNSYDEYQEVLNSLEADKSKNCIYISSFCQNDTVPRIEDIFLKLKNADNVALIGLSQFIQFREADEVVKALANLLQLPIRGHVVVLTEHLSEQIKGFMGRDPRLNRRIVLMDSVSTSLPEIQFSKTDNPYLIQESENSFAELIHRLERADEAYILTHSSLTVKTSLSLDLFLNSMYPVREADGIYSVLCRKYNDFNMSVKQSYGTDEQWFDLSKKLLKLGTLSSVFAAEFNNSSDFQTNVALLLSDTDNNNKLWYLWLNMKINGVKDNTYLDFAVKQSESYKDLEELIYMALINIDVHDEAFALMYRERKLLIAKFPENLLMIDKYCSRVGVHEKNAVFYLTDLSEKEQYRFVYNLSIYDYSIEEIRAAAELAFPDIAAYLMPFEFTEANTALSDADKDFRRQLTAYFNQYKLQKLTNHLFPDFLTLVNQYAEQQPRPYNKLQARTSLISKMDRSDSQLFFFDALGVEYLAYIQYKCEKYGLLADISIGKCQLPSITSQNKDFLKFFSSCNKIDDLDEIKHDNTIIDYEKCKEPLHLFMELSIIDKQLRLIQSMLIQGQFQKAYIVSDHGASRLAVICEHESQSKIEADEKGAHSGRCCELANDPEIACAAYENGHAILANYDRFKGSRKANVEVHGGASLEETVIPIIVITKVPEKLEVCFIPPVVELHGKNIAEITVFTNIPMKQPIMYVEGFTYKGELVGDAYHAKFALTDLKRTRDYTADIYDGSKCLIKALPFRIEKKTVTERKFIL